MNSHGLTLEQRMKCLAYLLVFVVHITSPHECIVTLQIMCMSHVRLRIHLSIPLAYLQSIVSMPKTKIRYCWITRITLAMYDWMISHINTHLKWRAHFTDSIFCTSVYHLKVLITLDTPKGTYLHHCNPMERS